MAGKSIRTVELERKTVGRNLLDKKRVEVGKRRRRIGEKGMGEFCRMVEINLKKGTTFIVSALNFRCANSGSSNTTWQCS